MHDDQVYNPLDKVHLAESVVQALIRQKVHPLPPEMPFAGAGIYAVYYSGSFPVYAPIADQNRNEQYACPIYVGKAIPAGGRKGFAVYRDPGFALFRRMREHADSVTQASNLSSEDFFCRYLILDELWIPLGETLMIQHFRPLWNAVIDGFGNHDPGSGRYRGMCPAWDILHPGRAWAGKCNPNPKLLEHLLGDVQHHLARPD